VPGATGARTLKRLCALRSKVLHPSRDHWPAPSAALAAAFERQGVRAASRPGAHAGFAYFARNPASVMSCRWLISALVSHLTNSAPDNALVLKAPFSMNSFQSGVSRTFFIRSP
jgi:hypothetical protein